MMISFQFAYREGNHPLPLSARRNGRALRSPPPEAVAYLLRVIDMNIYRITGYSSGPIERVPDPPTWEGSRVDRCFVDYESLESLNNLVCGPIRNTEDLWRAEIALRSLILHNNIFLLQPGVHVSNQFDLTSDPLRYSISLGGDCNFPGIQDVLNAAGWHARQWCIDDLYTFSTTELESQYIDAYNASKHRKLERKREIERQSNYIAPTFWMDMGLGTFDKVATSLQEYYEIAFLPDERLVSNFLKPLPRTGLANYLSNQVFRHHQEKISRWNANTFFDALDKSWENNKDLLDFQLGLPIHPFLAIVLNEARNRAEIPSVILSLRHEFQQARNQLWELFDDVQLRNADISVTRRILGDISRQTQEIVPQAFSKGDSWISISFQFLARLIWLSNTGHANTGVKETIDKLISTTPGPFHMVDVASVLTNKLGGIEWNPLFSTHLTDSELMNLTNWQ